MLGKLAPYLVVGLAEMTLILCAMRFGFDVPIRGSLVFLFVMAARLPLRAALARPLHLHAGEDAGAGAADGAVVLPPVDLPVRLHLPARGPAQPLYAIGQLFPATHMVEIMRGVVLRDAGPVELLPNVLALVAISVLLVWASVARFKKLAL